MDKIHMNCFEFRQTAFGLFSYNSTYLFYDCWKTINFGCCSVVNLENITASKKEKQMELLKIFFNYIRSHSAHAHAQCRFNWQSDLWDTLNSMKISQSFIILTSKTVVFRIGRVRFLRPFESTLCKFPIRFSDLLLDILRRLFL